MKRDVKTLCPYCGVGCGLIAATDGKRVLSVRGDKDHPANFGRVCQKGGTVAQTVHSATRLRHAMVRREDGTLFPVTDQVATARAAHQLQRILDQHGPEAIGFYLSGQLTTESQYVANKFAKACLRTNHVDSNSRLCMASAASGMKLSFGSDAPPTSYADIELADAFFFIGSNAAECHPVLFDRVKEQISARGARCIVADPRRTATAEQADLYLPVKPGTDLALLNGLLRLVRDASGIDPDFIANHCEGWSELSALLDEYPAPRVAEICGLPESDLVTAAKILLESKRLLSFWTMGVNQTLQGTFTSNAIINLHLAMGQVGKPGCGPFSLTGQPNAMGGRDVGYMSHTLPGQRLIADPDDRASLEKIWNLPSHHLQSDPGYDAVRMFDALARGELKAIWIIGTNPAASMPNLPRVREGLEKAELVIVQDAYFPTETTRYAHIILPAAITFETTGTFCNSERRVSLMEQVIAPPGDARPDWWWVQSIGRLMRLPHMLWFNTAAEIFDEFARTTASRPNDQSGIHHELLRKLGPQQWPFPAAGDSSARRYEDAVFPTINGKARLWARSHEQVGERTSDAYPLLLTTGRVISQWHTRTRTGLVKQLNSRGEGTTIHLHPDDARQLKLKNGELAIVQSLRGATKGKVQVDPTISPGVVFMPIHWNELFGPQSSPNETTSDATDPISIQPTLKCCAVRVISSSSQPWIQNATVAATAG